MNKASSRPRIEVGAAVILHRGHVLISQRDQKSHLAGLWEFPGGKREQNESFEECVRREIQEELNVQVTVGSLFEAIEYEYPEKIVHLKFYQCEYVGGEPKALGCRQFQWVPLSDLASYPFPPANQLILQKLRQLEFSGTA
ncbi:MAG: 8-oxo-dGTP diphosphatase MutT [Terriglobia bacterium]